MFLFFFFFFQAEDGIRDLYVTGVQTCALPIFANLHRWKQHGVWGRAYEEWRDIASDQDDGRLYAVMLGRDEVAVRMRQSAPFVGLLPKQEVRRLNEKAAG